MFPENILSFLFLAVLVIVVAATAAVVVVVVVVVVGRICSSVIALTDCA